LAQQLAEHDRPAADGLLYGNGIILVDFTPEEITAEELATAMRVAPEAARANAMRAAFEALRVAAVMTAAQDQGSSLGGHQRRTHQGSSRRSSGRCSTKSFSIKLIL
jgi:hypothetical protein